MFNKFLKSTGLGPKQLFSLKKLKVFEGFFTLRVLFADDSSKLRPAALDSAPKYESKYQ